MGMRPSLAPYQVRRFIQEWYNIPTNEFMLHRHWLEDFMIILRWQDELVRILNAPPLPVADMVLRFRRWSLLSMAEAEAMRFWVLLEICGIPSHAWSAQTVQLILGDDCASQKPTPTTTVCADSRCFQALVWCSDLDSIPNTATIKIPEPMDRNVGAESFLRPKQIIHHNHTVLRYEVGIEILEIQDFTEDSSDDSDDWPDRHLSDSDEEDYPGFHQRSRSQPYPRRTISRHPGFGHPEDGVVENGGGHGPVDGSALACEVPRAEVDRRAPPSPLLLVPRSLILPIRFGRCAVSLRVGDPSVKSDLRHIRVD
ncbi:hypothetical protein C2845_PM05G21650 [Panicum miliaceum]|uniref:DUF4283 domain-containing protein n=1 Tax=Panicum miliaceum TaxID=4540 RepID=A0A3L6SXJ3_PANMI|nr:hypothetical protein C2845_PM05G21650 [Panicum miliaceum]